MSGEMLTRWLSELATGARSGVNFESGAEVHRAPWNLFGGGLCRAGHVILLEVLQGWLRTCLCKVFSTEGGGNWVKMIGEVAAVVAGTIKTSRMRVC